MIVWFICSTWNRRNLAADVLLTESKDDWERRGSAIPNFNGAFELLEDWGLELYPQHDFPTFSRATVSQFLQNARMALAEIYEQAGTTGKEPDEIAELKSNSAPYCDALKTALQKSLENICRAWHLRYVPQSDLKSLSADSLDSASHTIVQWDFSFRLVDVG
jgi:hypothetical protein